MQMTLPVRPLGVETQGMTTDAAILLVPPLLIAVIALLKALTGYFSTESNQSACRSIDSEENHAQL